MKKLVAATAFGIAALAMQSAAACDWNREASTGQQTVATAPPEPTPQTTSQAQTAAAEATKPIEPTAPVVLVNDRH
jgi:hypothetical protein